jgi:hypothetical protein
MSPRSAALAVVLAAVLAAPVVEARERALASGRDVCVVCWAARPAERMNFTGDAVRRGQARARHDEERLRALETVYKVEVPAAAYGFREYEPDEGILAIDTRHNFRLFGGRVDLYATSNEGIEFELAADQAATHVSAHRAGRQKLRLGFLLAFDDPDSDPCLIRPAASFTVRADLAYAELVDAGGRVVARMTTERLDEVVPDAGEIDAPGAAQSPPPAGQVTVTPPTITGDPRRRGAIDQWVSTEGGAAIGALLEPCRVVGARSGRVVGSLAIAMDVEASGAPANLRVEVDSMSNEVLSACVLEKLGTLRLPSGRSRVQMTLPLLFANR